MFVLSDKHWLQMGPPLHLIFPLNRIRNASILNSNLARCHESPCMACDNNFLQDNVCFLRQTLVTNGTSPPFDLSLRYFQNNKKNFHFQSETKQRFEQRKSILPYGRAFELKVPPPFCFCAFAFHLFMHPFLGFHF